MSGYSWWWEVWLKRAHLHEVAAWPQASAYCSNILAWSSLMHWQFAAFVRIFLMTESLISLKETFKSSAVSHWFIWQTRKSGGFSRILDRAALIWERLQLGVMWLSFQCMYLSGEVVEPQNSKCQYSCSTECQATVRCTALYLQIFMLSKQQISMLSKDLHVI